MSLDDNGQNPRRLYRDTTRGKIFGVCAGIADYFGFQLCATRVLVIIAALFFMPFVVFAYFALALLLPAKPDGMYKDATEEKFWRSIRTAPSATFSSVRYRFRQLEARVQKMERYVTSPRFNLDREFADLERGDHPPGPPPVPGNPRSH